MSTAQFSRAKLIPYDSGGSELEDANAIPLDFNPETLTLKVSSGEARDRGRSGRQQTQNVGASKATLAFECIFDSTRPRDDGGGSGGGDEEEQLDVRLRTKPIADLIQVEGSGRDQAPRRVQFSWGTLVFNGVISDHQEVFDYFSPSGVPLRSKVRLTLTEQDFRYEVTSEDAARRRDAIDQANAGARAAAAAAGAGSLLGGAGGGLGLDLDLDLSIGFDLELGLDIDLNIGLSAELGFSAKFGASADIGLSLSAGVDLDIDAAVDLFGGAALSAGASGGVGAGGASPAAAVAGSSGVGAGGADLGRTSLALSAASPTLGVPGRPASTWALEGPAPGSKAADLAAVVNANRAAGSVDVGAGAATPVRGSPPLSPRRPIEGEVPTFTGEVPIASASVGERRPRWETLPPVESGAGEYLPGCGCRRCK